MRQPIKKLTQETVCVDDCTVCPFSIIFRNEEESKDKENCICGHNDIGSEHFYFENKGKSIYDFVRKSNKKDIYYLKINEFNFSGTDIRFLAATIANGQTIIGQLTPLIEDYEI